MDGTWDAEADAAYVDLRGEDRSRAVEQVTACTAPGRYEVILDLSPAGKLLGVEILGAADALDPTLLRTLRRIDDGATAEWSRSRGQPPTSTAASRP